MGSGASKGETEATALEVIGQDNEFGHQGAINCMSVSEDSSLLVTGSDDCTACVWSTKTENMENLGVLK